MACKRHNLQEEKEKKKTIQYSKQSRFERHIFT